MASLMNDSSIRVISYILLPFLVSAILLGLTRIYTTLSYHWTLRHSSDGSKPGAEIVKSPQIPYTIPWLGNALAFFSPYPGRFWDELFSWHPRNSGVCTLLIAGKRTHVLFTPTAVQFLFRTKTASRDNFDRLILPKIFAMTPDQVELKMETRALEHELMAKYLIKTESVNDLTHHFTRILDDILVRDSPSAGQEIMLYDSLRDHMFEASVRAFLGERVFDIYPEFCEDIYKFDREFLSFFFEMPKFMIRSAYATREKLLTKLTEWRHAVYKEVGGKPQDPAEGPSWDPIFGARLNRGRQLYYEEVGLTDRSAAALDMGLIFALASNIVPATGWMLLHLLNPNARDKTVLPRLVTELQQAVKDDGSIDIATLISGPLLQSVWTETLRLYADVLVGRNILEDVNVPLDEDGKRYVSLKKGDDLWAPSWLGHQDPNAWESEVPSNVWHADRFIKKDPKTGEESFTMVGTNGKFFPFGGGKTICPGRVFAKQEGLGALAMLLLRFDFDVVTFVDGESKPTTAFPGFTKTFNGAGAIPPNGDLKVKLRKRS